MTAEEIALAHQRGRLEQSCPACGRWEAAGGYCTACGRPMTAADWYQNGDQARRAVARQVEPRAAQTPLKGGSAPEIGSVDPDGAQKRSRRVAA